MSDGQRNYSWDAENRLVGIAYPGQPGKATAFAYDGQSRRTSIANTPAGGGSPVTSSFIWCGSRPCQARNAAGATTREYYGEGEFVPGSPAQGYYYGPDQVGSVRRVFASTGSAPAYSYDPYGNPLQAAAALAEFSYGGMLGNADSGLYLTTYRAYNPIVGRWLSRDPRGGAAAAANPYIYVDNDPLDGVDPYGLCTLQLGFGGGGGFGFLTGLIGLGIALDSQGNSGIYFYVGGGATVGANAEGGLSAQVSNGQTIGDLSGISTTPAFMAAPELVDQSTSSMGKVRTGRFKEVVQL